VRDSGRRDDTQPYFRPHVSKKRGYSVTLTVVFAVAIAAGLVLGYRFYTDDVGLVRHVEAEDRWAVPAVWVIDFKGGPAAAREPLLTALASAEDPALRRAAAGAVVHVETDAPFDLRALADASVDDEDPTVRLAVLEALIELGDPAAAPWIRTALDDEDVEVEAAACEAVGVFELDDRIPTLIAKLGRDKRIVKAAAKRALEAFTAEGETYGFDRKAWQGWYNDR